MGDVNTWYSISLKTGSLAKCMVNQIYISVEFEVIALYHQKYCIQYGNHVIRANFDSGARIFDPWYPKRALMIPPTPRINVEPTRATGDRVQRSQELMANSIP